MIAHIVGNRPQFIKLAPLYKELDTRGFKQTIIHSGQHYDDNMSTIFFDQLNIPYPSCNLGVGSGSHGEITGKAIIGIEKELIKTKPSLVVLYGDTNTTLAGAIATMKLDMSIAHVEAGVRTFNKNNPEERNRVVVDHVSDFLFCSNNSACYNLEKEGLKKKAVYTGDIMLDTFMSVSELVNRKEDEDIILMTWHRQETTSDKKTMKSILDFVKQIDDEIICPLHPRTVNKLKQFDLWDYAMSIQNYTIIDPVGYFEMVELLNRAKMVITDSGGLSKESSFAGARCLFFADLDTWPELMDIGWITKVDLQNEDLTSVLELIRSAHKIPQQSRPKCFGIGNAAKTIADILGNSGLEL